MRKKVAVIDIGSNTIKLLVAGADQARKVDTLYHQTLETRIGKGLSSGQLLFSPETIESATHAVTTLANEARARSADEIRVVATSAGRDAANANELAEAIEAKTNLSLEILSGDREAELIGRAVQLDAGLPANDFYVFDLGGGSLECIRFANRRLEQVASLPLGAVRIAEKLLPDPAAIFSAEDEQRVAAEVKQGIDESGFAFSLPAEAPAIGTGGTLTTVLNIRAAEQNKKLQDLDPYLSSGDLRLLLARTAALPLPERLSIEGLSAGRADVFPTALTIFLTLLDLTSQKGVHHSLQNLRYGLAAEMLEV